MAHKVRVNVVTKDNRKEMLYAGKKISLPRKLVRLLFGEATQILIMQPGQSVEQVEFIELPKTATKAE
ncbi:hypothetical protein [Anaerosporobacter faecicola]|uniref:hypothetical protein n=1 Tax=Anaerosporobacter faecicola TaxID=2718714 RepID=UPI00143BFC67|nr:hypothetical protein [Anaerosporobacter faecicola]